MRHARNDDAGSLAEDEATPEKTTLTLANANRGPNMKQILELKAVERADVFTQAGVEIGLPAYYVEKDFWVCWVIGLLFGHGRMGPHLTFRGGTSLSKGWGLISRFSEDVDIAMSREWVDPTLPNPGDAGLTAAARDRRLRQLRRACRKAIRDEVVPLLEASAAALGEKARVEVVSLDEARDPFEVRLHYPLCGLEVPERYHQQVVKIELSGRADAWPQEHRPISPFLADALPKLGPWVPMQVACVMPARTFWEKASLLHERYAQGTAEKLGVRQARHLYDLVQLWTHVRDESGLLALFDEVKVHRKTFFNYGCVDYEHLTPGGLVLVPPDDQIAAWKGDYEMMGSMFIGDRPPFDHLIEAIGAIEDNLRRRHRPA